MSPDEEYCRVVYERQFNNTIDLSLEVYDVGGVSHKSKHQRQTEEGVTEILQDIVGDGWETIFAQEYRDWAIYCKKRPRNGALHRSAAVTQPMMSRKAILGALGVCTALLIFGWIAGLIATSGNQPASVSSEDSATSAPATEGDGAAEPVADLEDEAEDSDLGDAAEGSAADDETASVALDTESGSGAGTVTAIALQSSGDRFDQAVRIAQETVLEGRVANTQEEWETLAERWQQAADLMGDVPSEDARYDVAQDRSEQYENNHDAALSEADKF